MIPTRILSTATFLLTLALAASAWSDDPPKAEAPPDPCQTELTLEKLDNPPERKTKFEVVEEVWKEKLVDVKAADQEFVAVIRISLPKDYEDLFGRGVGHVGAYFWHGNVELRRLLDLQIFPDGPFLRPRGGSSMGATRPTFAESFRRMLAQIPKQRLPAEDDREFFASSEINRLVISPWLDRSYERPQRKLPEDERQLLLLATTPEQAEKRAQVLLSILDQGFTQPLQVALFKDRIKHCKQLEGLKVSLPLVIKESESVAKEIKESEEFTPDLLAGLRVQQLQMEVDVAGVKARIATCERLIAKTDIPERRKQIEDAKIAAEIELAGFEARRAKSAEFVAKVKSQNELIARAKVAKSKQESMYAEIKYITSIVKAIDEEIAAFAPVTLVDDRVTIHPLEWTQ